MSDDPSKSEETFNNSKSRTSPNAEGPFEWENETTSSPLYKAIQDSRRQIDADEVTEQLSARDVRLAALIRALEETDQLADIAAEAGAALGRNTDDVPETRAETLRLLIRVGLHEVAPETIQTAVEANKEYLVNQADEF
jgi:hypothetical protein